MKWKRCLSIILYTLVHVFILWNNWQNSRFVRWYCSWFVWVSKQCNPSTSPDYVKQQTLLFLIWLRCYSTYHMLSSLFNISVTTVKEELSYLIELYHVYCFQFVSWPPINKWGQMLIVWKNCHSSRCNRWNIL